MNHDLQQLCQIAIKAAHSAGEIIRQHADSPLSTAYKEAGSSLASQVVTEIDKACEKKILSLLHQSIVQNDLGLLSEETEDNNSRFKKKYFWCIDPLDGTLAFIHKKPGFAVSIALVSQEGIPQIGVVYDPSKKNTYYAINGAGAFKNGKPLQLKKSNSHLTYVTDRSIDKTIHFDKIEVILNTIMADLNINEVRVMAGSGSVLNAIHVLENAPACMIKMPKDEVGGGSIWDFAATTCIFNELGLKATDVHGQQLDLNKMSNTFMNNKGIFFANL